MPLTFIDIERQKSWRIAVLFLVLIALYFVITLAIAASFYPVASLGGGLLPGSGYLITVIFFSIVLASMHFYLSAYNAVSHIKNNLSVIEPDPEDGIHKRLVNIMQEIHVVTGNNRNIQCVVVPTLSMNALSAIDLKGNAIIAITEGLLSRVSRTQLEAVMAHEACHIISGDCLESTIAASLFGLPSAAIEKISSVSSGRIYTSPAFLFAWLMVKSSYVLNMIISREREYRADAGSVRMTRNPLALAEVLYMLSRNWRGTGFIGRGLEMLCIMNPSDSGLDESEGWFSDLMSTHPPIRERIRILLDMAKASVSDLKKTRDAGILEEPFKPAGDLFYGLDSKNQWQGPFTLMELAALPWLSTLTWVSQNGKTLDKASDIPVIHNIFRERLALQGQAISEYQCPLCRQSLLKRYYEETTIYQCTFCGGSLIENTKIPRIIARDEIKYSGRIKELSRFTLNENQAKRIFRNKKKVLKTNVVLLNCPRCKREMSRTFYSLAYLVELDRCSYCGLTWFDCDELEMLQCMIDNKMASLPLEQ